MTVLIDNRQSQIEFEKDIEEFIENVVKAVLDYEDCKVNYEVSVSLVNNEEIKDLNREYRNIDNATDVLSFPMMDFDKETKEVLFMVDDDLDNDEEYFEEELPLGDIVISAEKAKEQAEEFGHGIIRELAFLLIHGTLHLLGYDHENKDDEIIMFSKQKEILELLNIKR